jgi:hypothetical protein
MTGILTQAVAYLELNRFSTRDKTGCLQSLPVSATEFDPAILQVG